MNNSNSFTYFHKLRFYLLISFLAIFGFVLIIKLIHLQFYSNAEELDIIPETLVKNIILEPSHGDIYAADGNILATSVTRYSLHWDAVTPSLILFNENKQSLADSIAELTGIGQ